MNALTRELKRCPFVGSVAQQIGRAELADDTWPVNYEEMHVDLKPLRVAASIDYQRSSEPPGGGRLPDNQIRKYFQHVQVLVEYSRFRLGLLADLIR